MRVEVVERIPEFRAGDAQATEDPSVKLALKNFQNAIQSDDSFFDNHGKGMGPIVAEGDGNATCGGSFLEKGSEGSPEGPEVRGELQRFSGHEGAADTEAALSGLLFPHRLQVDANGRKNRNV